MFSCGIVMALAYRFLVESSVTISVHGVDVVDEIDAGVTGLSIQ